MAQRPPWYQRPWAVSLLCATPLLACYLTTTAPDLTWAHSNEDSGDLVTAAYIGGIPHPTGYPFYLITCKLLMLLVPIGSIAFRAHLYSIVMGITGACLLGQACRRIAPFVFTTSIPFASSATDPSNADPDSASDSNSDSSPPLDKSASREGVGGVLPILWQVGATLLAGASFTVWSQSIIAEVYAANFAFIGALLLILTWYLTARDDRERGRALCWYAGALGLAMTNHLTSAYMAVVGVAVLLWYLRLPPAKAWIRAVLCFIAPFTLYLYLLIRSRANPALDWSNTEVLGNLYLHMTGKQFRYLLLGQEQNQVVRRLFLEMDFIVEYGYALTIAALIGIGWGLVRSRPEGRAFVIALLVLWGLNIWHICNYAVEDFEAFLVPAVASLGALVALGLVALGSLMPARWMLRIPLAWALVLAPAIWVATNTYPRADIPIPTDPVLMAEDAKSFVLDDAMIIERFYGRGFAWWYFTQTDPHWDQHGIEVVYTETLRSNWGRAILAREHPSVRLTTDQRRESTIIRNLVEENIDRRAIYTGFTPFFGERFSVAPAGRLYQIHRAPGPWARPSTPQSGAPDSATAGQPDPASLVFPWME